MAGGESDHISLSEVGRAWESYAMLLGYGAKRGVNKTTLKWDRPLPGNKYFGQCDQANMARLPKGNIGAGLMNAAQVSGFPKIR